MPTHTIVVYFPPNSSGAPYAPATMVWMLIDHALEQDDALRFVVANSSGKLPQRWQNHERMVGVKAKPVWPGAAGRALVRKKLNGLCGQYEADFWAPLGIPFALDPKLQQVIGLPWPPKQEPLRWQKIMAAHQWPATATFAMGTLAQQQYWQARVPVAGIQSVVTGQAAQYQPETLSWAMGEAIKTRHAGGYEYWLYYGPMELEDDIIFILKAFSRFKKRHHTNMAMVLMGYGVAPAGLVEKLKTYAFRQSVFLAEHLAADERRRLLATCYALVRPPKDEPYSRALLEAMVQGTLCLVPHSGMDHALAGEACVSYDNEEGLFKAMSRAFTDEMMRNRMKEASISKATEYAPAEVWQRLHTCFSKKP